MAYKLALAALCLLLLCGCSGAPFAARVEDLLEAPRLNQRQAEIYQALEATVDVSTLLYRYPQRGDYRSPFLFYDLDGDGVEEAIVFYSMEGDEDYVRATILSTDEQGGWRARTDFTNNGNGDQVDFIQFANLLSEDWPCMVIGWQDSRSATTLGVYSYYGGQFTREFTEQSYHSYDIDSYVGGELQEIALVELDSTDTFRLYLFGKNPGGQLGSLGDIQLSPDVNEVLHLQRGTLWEGLSGVYVDERRTDTLIATEIIQVEPEGLTMIVGESADIYNYMTTCREDESLLSIDLDGDGYVDIPTESDLPWVLEIGELQPPPLIEYIRVQQDESFVYSSRAVRNEDWGYMVFFPEHWLSEDGMVQVTVLRRPESNEWRFYKIDPDFDTATVELLRIQVYSTRDYRDQFSEGFLLAEKGIYEYYGYIPRTAGEPLSVTEAQVKELFMLLS